MPLSLHLGIPHFSDVWQGVEFIMATSFETNKITNKWKEGSIASVSQNDELALLWKINGFSLHRSDVVLVTVLALVGLNSPTIFFQIMNFNHNSISLSVLNACQFDLCRKPPALIAHRISHISECSWMYLQLYWLLPAFICLALCGTCLLAACLRTLLICYVCCISVGKPLLKESIKQTHGIPTVCSDLQNLFSYHS